MMPQAVQCLGVQDSFFKFAAPYLTSTTGDRLHYRVTLDVGSGDRVRFECFNTAWLSQKHEEQGQIRMAPQVACRLQNPVLSTVNDFVIALLHHPFGWFDSTNRRRVQAELEKHSDLIITGHEHVPDRYHRVNSNAASVQYIEGGVLQGDRGTSSFNVVKLDFEGQQQELIQFTLQGSSYSVEHRSGPSA